MQEGSTGPESVDKPWDHAWSTEEMRKNRRDWSLAGDSGLLKHIQQFSDVNRIPYFLYHFLFIVV